MGLFSGTALFSPTIPVKISLLWTEHGGTLLSRQDTVPDASKANWIFGSGIDDPWVKMWRARYAVVFHAAYVLRVLSEGVDHKLIPIGRYVIDARLRDHEILNKRLSDPKILSEATPIAALAAAVSAVALQIPTKRKLATKDHVYLVSKVDDGDRLDQDGRPFKRPRFKLVQDNLEEKVVELGKPYEITTSKRISKVEKHSQQIPHLDLATIANAKRNGADYTRTTRPWLNKNPGLWKSISSGMVDSKLAFTVADLMDALVDVPEKVVEFKAGGFFKGKRMVCVSTNRE